MNDAAKTRIQSVARAARLLLWVADQPHGASAKEIATSQGLALPTTYHLLNTLVDEGLLAKDVHRHYILGRSGAILAQAYLRGKAVPDGLLAALRELAAAPARPPTWRTGASMRFACSRPSRAAGCSAWPRWGAGSTSTCMRVRTASCCSPMPGPSSARRTCVPTRSCRSPKRRSAIARRSTASSPASASAVTPTTSRSPPSASVLAAPLLQNGQLIAAIGLSVPADRIEMNRAELTKVLLDVAAAATADPRAAPELAPAAV